MKSKETKKQHLQSWMDQSKIILYIKPNYKIFMLDKHRQVNEQQQQWHPVDYSLH